MKKYLSRVSFLNSRAKFLNRWSLYKLNKRRVKLVVSSTCDFLSHCCCEFISIRDTRRSVCVSAWIDDEWDLNWWLANDFYVMLIKCESRDQASYTWCSIVSSYLDTNTRTSLKNEKHISLIHLSEISYLTRLSPQFSCSDWLSFVSLTQWCSNWSY